jgi:hypothetical protein
MIALDQLDDKLAELQAERATLGSTKTRKDLAALAEDWLTIARNRASGAIGSVLNGHATPDYVGVVLAEYALQDPKLGTWLVSGLEQLDTVGILAKAKAAKVGKLDTAIAKATAELREASKARRSRRSSARSLGQARDENGHAWASRPLRALPSSR